MIVEMMNTVLGTELSPEDQRYALRVYIYRHTVENLGRNHSKSVPGILLDPITDAEWLASTRFFVTSKGRLDRRVNHCEHTAPVSAWRDIPDDKCPPYVLAARSAK